MFDETDSYAPLDIPAYIAMRDAGTPHLLLDVREPDEYQQAHVEGALLMPMSDVMDRVNELHGHEHIVVMCRSGNRSATVASALHDLGVTAKVYNLEGGIVAWANQGHPYVSGDE